ncbi:hypothetical protein [Candidatus Pantoea bituminis]|uniref:hypothetical protein n=1 Tax=Candidatus Pantoea bituminis TaxID=2831036 RepID=UPI001C061A98|nr:hypothetical protein [Pantoea bituminis]
MALSISLAAFKVNAGGESITSFETTHQPGMADTFWSLPDSNLYMVCLAKRGVSFVMLKPASLC